MATFPRKQAVFGRPWAFADARGNCAGDREWGTAKLIDATIQGKGVVLANGLSGKSILLLSFCGLIFLLEEIFSVFHGGFADFLKVFVYQ
jgi:hypothetical protein